MTDVQLAADMAARQLLHHLREDLAVGEVVDHHRQRVDDIGRVGLQSLVAGQRLPALDISKGKVALVGGVVRKESDGNEEEEC